MDLDFDCGVDRDFGCGFNQDFDCDFDAISIAIALLIVSLVAAIQEYRSEVALEKLASLVPHTCTVLRDGRVMDGFLARDLVVGDLVLLATGE